jgi:hypothetical protein
MKTNREKQQQKKSEDEGKKELYVGELKLLFLSSQRNSCLRSYVGANSRMNSYR